MNKPYLPGVTPEVSFHLSDHLPFPFLYVEGNPVV